MHHSRLALIALMLPGPACSPPDGQGEPAQDGLPLEDAPAPAPATGLPERTAHAYTCGNTDVVARLEDDGSLRLFLPDATVELPHVPAASGARYSDGEITFWSRGDAAALLDLGDGEVPCMGDPFASVREDAKLRGVSFRGQGNEPPWILEMGPDSIVVYTGYESRRNAFPLVDPEIDRDERTTTWESTDASGRTVRIRVSVPEGGSRCQDTMADVTYESTVIVVLDGDTLRGCGNPLH